MSDTDDIWRALRLATEGLRTLRTLDQAVRILNEQLSLALERITYLEKLTAGLSVTDSAGQVVMPPMHTIGPREGAILFGADEREVQPGEQAQHDLLSTCQCGRQIMKGRSDGGWTHVD